MIPNVRELAPLDAMRCLHAPTMVSVKGGKRIFARTKEEIRKGKKRKGHKIVRTNV